MDGKNVYLKRVTIVGFKSFANKTVLDLEPGLTAVVGPNGSGKSNVADAIRWALGEQSKSRLRLGDREAVVFAGSDKRPKASLAEVTLLFDNEDGAFPLGLTEVEISRRLYRSGETEYRLAGRPVKLGDLQQLLAEAGFGAGSYAVIGQGTIDSLLLSSPAERKLLFDEAAGIRGAELKREASIRKLAATEANLVRLRDIAAELAPRAASLERARAASAEQAKLEAKVSDLRATITATAEDQLGRELGRLGAAIAALESEQATRRRELEELGQEQADQLAAAAAAQTASAERTRRLTELETERDRAAAELAQARAEQTATRQRESDLPALKHKEAGLAAELAALDDERHETRADLKALDAQMHRATTAIEAAGAVVAAAQAELVEVRQQLHDGTREQYVGHALELVKTMARHLDEPDADAEQLRLLVHKTGRLLSHASRTGESDLAARLKDAQAKLEAAMTKRETATEHQSNVILSRRSLELEQARQDELAERLRVDLAAIRDELAQAATDRDASTRLDLRVTRLEASLAQVTAELDTVRQEVSAVTSATAVAGLAVRLERLGAEVAAGESELGRLHTQHEAARRLQKSYRDRAVGWGVKAGSASAQPLGELDATLLRLEGELEARVQLGHDLTTEYDEVTQRQTELVGQIVDLEAAAADLATLVERLGQTVQEKFKTNFERLGHEFSRQAARLFDGGSASLSLSEDESGQYGIEIKLSPKGKRLASLAALSGGERALAGVALLAAILQTNPTPFVVLDEVDAALDDANSGRLAEIMGELAEHSQLIVITHNRQTMAAARILFGVTMNDHHVSHLLSLHLEAAAELAAR
jgi:chromosome segregation ATPase